MVCKNCNRILPEGTSFCVYCGTPVAQDIPATMPVDSMAANVPESHTAPYTVPVGMSEEAYVASMGGAPAEVVEAPVVIPEEPAAVPYTVPVNNVPEPIDVTPVVHADPIPVPVAVPVNVPPVQIPQAPVVKAPAANPLQKYGTIIMGALAVLAVALLIWGISASGNLAEEKELRQNAKIRYEAQIEELEDTVDELNDAIENKDAAIADLQVVSDAYYNMYEELRTHNIGSATYNFQATDDFIVVRKSNTGYKFTLTAHWRDGGTVSVDYSSPCARISFDKETWVKTVPVTVLPQEVGFTVVTFSNSVDSNTFSILILVVE